MDFERASEPAERASEPAELPGSPEKVQNWKVSMKKFIAGVIVGILLMIVVPLLVAASGLINMGAAQGPGMLEKTMARWAFGRSLAVHAPRKENPLANDPKARATGLVHFGAMCAQCHGAPGVQPDELAAGLNPPAPVLEEEVSDFSDGELFWIVKNGVRMTGMPAFGPTHTDDEIWAIAAFLRHLPELTAAEQKELREMRGQADQGEAADQHAHEAHDHDQGHGEHKH